MSFTPPSHPIFTQQTAILLRTYIDDYRNHQGKFFLRWDLLPLEISILNRSTFSIATADASASIQRYFTPIGVLLRIVAILDSTIMVEPTEIKGLFETSTNEATWLPSAWNTCYVMEYTFQGELITDENVESVLKVLYPFTTIQLTDFFIRILDPNFMNDMDAFCTYMLKLCDCWTYGSTATLNSFSLRDLITT